MEAPLFPSSLRVGTWQGEERDRLDESHPVDAAHAAYSRRVKEPGWEELEPMFMLTPAHLRDVMQKWGALGFAE